MPDGLFDSANYPALEPETLRRGDRWAWKRIDLGSTYPPASYALTYEAVRWGDLEHGFSLTANESGSDYLIEVASATTAGYVAGTYQWHAFITRSSDSERLEVGQGTWAILANAATERVDPRSSNEKILEALKAVLEGRADDDIASYTVAGQSVVLLSPMELVQWITFYEQRVAVERNTQRHRRGCRGVNTIQARF